ncbi:MAG: citrate lyase subunit alpha [Piscinibacter sp.]|nr:citrate lyase subunit alpha [Piscinibacter sp.]
MRRGVKALPAFIEGYGEVRPFTGRTERPPTAPRAAVERRVARPGGQKLLAGLPEAFDACGLRDGAVLSFHHHLRNGDAVLNRVLDAAAEHGLQSLTVAASSIFPVHAPLVRHIERGVVSRIVTSYVSGPVADAIAAGRLPTPVVMQTHGGRAMSIETGRLLIDAAFVAAPTADAQGNLAGAVGPAACGPLGYAMVDAAHARHVVAVTDHFVDFPALPIDIPQGEVDFVVRVNSIGDAAGIPSGTTRPTDDPVGLHIASLAARAIEASGLLGPDFSFQTGAGGISLAVARDLAQVMAAQRVQGSFAAGGVTGALCEMLEAGLFRSIFDVQCFDLQAVRSYRDDPRHVSMSASVYANPFGRGALVDQLKTMVLGAAEIDLDFNVNVTMGANGRILGGSGGHADTADGAELALVTTRLGSAAGPKLVREVACVTTPGSTIDLVVTEAGIAVPPRRRDLAERLARAGLPLKPLEELQRLAERQHPCAPAAPREGRIVGVVEYRDGSVIDLLRAA